MTYRPVLLRLNASNWYYGTIFLPFILFGGGLVAYTVSQSVAFLRDIANGADCLAWAPSDIRGLGAGLPILAVGFTPLLPDRKKTLLTPAVLIALRTCAIFCGGAITIGTPLGYEVASFVVPRYGYVEGPSSRYTMRWVRVTHGRPLADCHS